MKTLYKITMICFFLGLYLVPQKAGAQASVSFQVFYDNLSPYGSWINSPSYGYVWVPRVSGGFIPYNTNGYWVYTDVGWTWVSNYNWGWAPFHYGRWYYDSYYGWTWVPDNQWGPGWVTWRSSGDYYGWAPIQPGISISVAYGNSYSVPNNYWTFVGSSYFGRPNMHQHYVSSSRNVTIINNTTVVNNIYKDNSRNVRYNRGPDRIDVQKRTGAAFNPVTIKNRAAPGQNVKGSQLELYRPQVVKNSDAANRPQPKKIATREDVKSNATPKAAVREIQDKQNTRRNNSAGTIERVNQKREAVPQRQLQQPARTNTPQRQVQPSQLQKEKQQQRSTLPQQQQSPERQQLEQQRLQREQRLQIEQHERVLQQQQRMQQQRNIMPQQVQPPPQQQRQVLPPVNRDNRGRR